MKDIDLKSLDNQDSLSAIEHSNKVISLSEDYSFHRNKLAKAEYELEVLLSQKINEYREKKKNIGYDMAKLMLMEENDNALQAEKEVKYHKAKCDGLDKVIQSMTQHTSLIQSLIKIRLKEA